MYATQIRILCMKVPPHCCIVPCFLVTRVISFCAKQELSRDKTLKKVENTLSKPPHPNSSARGRGEKTLIVQRQTQCFEPHWTACATA